MSVARYDSIILGSGISGLTAAVLLAKLEKRKVLVLEQHNIIGGFTHTFRRGKFEWDTGLHYVGAMAPGEFPRKMMDFVSGGKVDWRKMPDIFEVFHFPAFQFGQRTGEKNFRDDLISRFPKDEPTIRKYFSDLLSAQLWGTLGFAAQVLPAPLAWIPRLAAWPLSAWGRLTLGDYFEKNVANRDLRAVLSGPCGDYGLAPIEASFFVHALVVRHYLNGGFYPAGGSGVIPENVAEHLRKLGADVLTRHQATEILIEKGRVRGVRAKHGEKEKIFYAPHVISCVGARQTYGRLLKGQFGAEIRDFQKGISLASIYLGLRESPAKLGFRGENHWLFSDTDFEAMQAAGEGCYISFPSLKDPSLRNHTAEIMVPARFEEFAELSEGGWKRRGDAYGAAKAELAERTLAFVESRFPGFKDLIEYVEVATPLSVNHFTLHADGEVYGLPGVPEKFRLKNLGPRTPVKGLYLAGADVFAHGIVGAMMSGFCAFTASLYPWQIIKAFRALTRDNPAI